MEIALDSWAPIASRGPFQRSPFPRSRLAAERRRQAVGRGPSCQEPGQTVVTNCLGVWYVAVMLRRAYARASDAWV